MAVAAAIPIEDTDDVKAAKATFKAAFDAATAGEHIALRPAATATAYLDDAEDVAAAKAEFQAVFDKYAAGEVALPVAPVHEVAPVSIHVQPSKKDTPNTLCLKQNKNTFRMLLCS